MRAETPESHEYASPVEWVNAYPQGISASTWAFPVVAFLHTILFAAIITLTARSEELTVFLCVFYLMAIAFWWLLTASALAPFSHANRHPNAPMTPEPGRAVITTPLHTEPLLLVTGAIAFISGCMLMTWIEDPFSTLPFDSTPLRTALIPYLGIAGALLALCLVAARPWHRRIVLTADAIEYRRFGGPVTIPWDTIEELTTEDRGAMKALIVRARPPAVVPHLDRKKLPDGTTRGTLAIQAMTVDPGTITYALTRLWKEPDSRRLLDTHAGTDELFTGPSWHERIRMNPGQTWAPPDRASS